MTCSFPEALFDPHRVLLCDAQIGTGECGPLFGSSRVGFEQVGNSEPRAQRRAIAAVEAEEFLGGAVAKPAGDAPGNPFAHPACTQTLALQAEIGQCLSISRCSIYSSSSRRMTTSQSTIFPSPPRESPPGDRRSGLTPR
jgi:hypothetical protein